MSNFITIASQVPSLLISPSKASAFPHAPIYGGSNQVKSVTSIVKDNDQLTITDNITAKSVQSFTSFNPEF